MNEIPRAIDFFVNHPSLSASEIMKDFAKLHVEAALKAASEKAIAIPSEEDIEEYVDKDSILNSYPLKNIK